MDRNRVCIVTPGYLGSTPRVVKEADALAGAGMDVRVVTGQGPIERLRSADEGVARGRSWRWRPVRWPGSDVGRGTWFSHQLARRLPSSLLGVPGVAERAERRITVALGRAASEEAADLFIGHYPAGLAAAARAAARHGVRYAYDAEDLHTGEHPDTPDGRRATRRTRILEARYLPDCAHVTSASDGIGVELAARYGISTPETVHNVFPLADRDDLDGETRDRRGDAFSLYWYSQTLGLDRGLQQAIRAAGGSVGMFSFTSGERHPTK